MERPNELTNFELMENQKVYTLSTYEEYGSTGVIATLNPDNLPSMLATLKYANEAEAKALARIKENGYPIDPNGHDLSKDWGGIMLHIVELIP